MFKLAMLIMMSIVTIQAAPLLKTGQSSSYAVDGTVVTDGSIKDDGYYSRGMQRDYTRNNEVVTDNVTGLEWQDNAEANSTKKNYNNAESYCQGLVLDLKDDWRVPTVQELKTLVDYSEVDASVDGEFRYFSSYRYWSSTTYANDTGNAWFVNFYSGYSGYRNKYYGDYVRCVRGGQFDNSNFSRSGNTVSDTTTNLQWQDNGDVNAATRKWTDAIDYCEDLTLDGRTDWRIPNEIELFSIVNFTKSHPSIDTDIFQNISSSNYWSSTTGAGSTSSAWFVGFDSGNSDYSSKTIIFNYVRCVRGGEVDSLKVNPALILYLLN